MRIKPGAAVMKRPSTRMGRVEDKEKGGEGGGV